MSCGTAVLRYVQGVRVRVYPDAVQSMDAADGTTGSPMTDLTGLFGAEQDHTWSNNPAYQKLTEKGADKGCS